MTKLKEVKDAFAAADLAAIEARELIEKATGKLLFAHGLALLAADELLQGRPLDVKAMSNANAQGVGNVCRTEEAVAKFLTESRRHACGAIYALDPSFPIEDIPITP